MVGSAILSSGKDKLLPENTLVISNHVLGIKSFFCNTCSMFNEIIRTPKKIADDVCVQ